MSDKLISSEDVLSKIEKEIKDVIFITDPYEIKNDYDIGYNNALAMAKAIVMKAPAVDAVEVVRCGECVHCRETRNFRGDIYKTCPAEC